MSIIKNLQHRLRPMYVPIANWYYDTFRAPRRYHHLYDEIERTRARRILEVGTWNGNRAVEMIKKARSFGNSVDYVGFDLFDELSEELYRRELSKHSPSKREVKKKLAQTGAAVSLIQGNTLRTLPEFVKHADQFDFIFIDGGHDVATIKSDWNAVRQLMHSNTVVIFDDYWRNDATRAAKPVVDSIDREDYLVEVLPEIDVFDNADHGHLEISFAKVTVRKKETRP